MGLLRDLNGRLNKKAFQHHMFRRLRREQLKNICLAQLSCGWPGGNWAMLHVVAHVGF